MKNEKRPKLEIKQEPFDRQLDLLALVGVILLILLPIYFYNQLPETIPSHYGPNGEPDGFSSKATLWIVPIMGGLMFLGLSWLKKYPHKYNYPQPVTEENAESMYRNGTRLIRSMNAIITCVFAYMTYSTIQTALGRQNGLGASFTPIFSFLFLGSIAYYIFRMMQK